MVDFMRKNTSNAVVARIPSGNWTHCAMCIAYRRCSPVYGETANE